MEITDQLKNGGDTYVRFLLAVHVLVDVLDLAVMSLGGVAAGHDSSRTANLGTEQW